MKPLLIYCYDAYCGWCYGFSPIIRKLSIEFKAALDAEVLSGGMILPQTPSHISTLAPFIRDAYKTVESHTGITFGKDYLWHIFNEEESDWYPDSLSPAIALCIFKEYRPELQVEFAADLQYALHFEGRDLTDKEAYRHLLDLYHVPPDQFFVKFGSAEYEERARYEFDLVKKLKVTGFPTVLIQADEAKFHLVCRGFLDYDTLKENIVRVLQSITSDSSPSS